jgi:hypothetical protein
MLRAYGFCAAQSFCMHGLDAGSRASSPARGDPRPASYLIDMTMTCRAGASWHEACKASGEYRRQR